MRSPRFALFPGILPSAVELAAAMLRENPPADAPADAKPPTIEEYRGFPSEDSRQQRRARARKGGQHG